MVHSILYWCAFHFVIDFVGQPEWMGLNKGKYWEIMLYHCIIYASGFFLIGASVQAFIILFVSHLLIDPLKARYEVIKPIWLDQSIHIVIIIFLCVIGYLGIK